jgi:integrase
VTTTQGKIMAVSTSWLKAQVNKPQEKEVIKTHAHGLYARLRKSGSISFIFKYRYNGSRDKLTLGSYPRMTLAEAVTETAKCNAYLSELKDPKVERKLDVIRYTEKLTIEQMFNDWWLNRYKDHPLFTNDIRGTPFQTKRAFEMHVLPLCGQLAWDEAGLEYWATLLRALKEKAPHIALRIVTHIKSIGKYGVSHGKIVNNPLRDFSGISDLSIRKKKGRRVLSYEEIEIIYDTLLKTRSDERTKIVFQLLIIYGCRSKELRLAKKTHFDFERMIWTVPPELAKPQDLTDIEETAREIVRPILPETLPLFDRLFTLSNSDKYLFGNTRKSQKQGEPLSEGAWLDVPGRINMHIAKNNNGQTLPSWSKHDLRRTMRTYVTGQIDEGGIGVEPWLAEKMVGHKLSGVFETYDKGQYIPEKLRAYKLWYKVLDSIWNGKSEVVSINITKVSSIPSPKDMK